jgi:hypothetical protein
MNSDVVRLRIVSFASTVPKGLRPFDRLRAGLWAAIFRCFAAVTEPARMSAGKRYTPRVVIF